MKLFRFDEQTARAIERFDSVHAKFARIMRTPESVHIGCMHLGAGGVVGHHPAVVPQLFLVVSGEGWVRGEDDVRVPIAAGQAAFWTAGEGHESGTERGMVALVIEGEGLDPESFMPRC